MIGAYPIDAHVPRDYRYALDAAMTVLAGATAPAVICNVPQLIEEVRQRIPDWGEMCSASAAIWVEPCVGSWRRDLATIATQLPAGRPMLVVASRPLACLLPERRFWDGRPLGFLPGGIGRLCRALSRTNFELDATYGLHSPLAMGLSFLSRQMERWGRADLADRLHFAARLQYCTSGPVSALSTVALVLARKDR